MDNRRKVVLRVYPKKDTIKKGKELKISELLLDFPEIPKIHQSSSFTHNIFEWNVVDFVDRITLAEAQSHDHDLLLEVYFEIGIMLAKLKNITFPTYGLLNEKLEVQEIKTVTSAFHLIANFIMDCLNDKNFIKRVGVDLPNELHNLVIKQEHTLYEIEHESHLVHGDFKVENILVKLNLCSFLCSDADRVLLHRSTIKHLNDTIYYFKEGGNI